MNHKHLLKITSLLCSTLLLAFVSKAQPVTNVAAGGEFCLFLKGDGSLWANGYNDSGQLGDGTYNSTNIPEQIIPSGVTAIACGGEHSLFLKSDGSLWAMGYNRHGELGDSVYNTNRVDGNYGTNTPQLIVASGVTAIAAGANHSLFLKSNGSLWVMGQNNDGQLGFVTNKTDVPKQIVASGVTAIAAAGWHSLFIKSDGSLWGMGYDLYGQLGDGRTTNFVTLPEQIVASGVTAIAAGQYHSLFIKSDGSLWAMGLDDYGQLGDGTNDPTFGEFTHTFTNLPEMIVSSNVTKIAAGYEHSLFTKSDGSLWAMGYNIDGELGNGTTVGPVNLPEQIVASGVTAISAGAYHSMFSKSSGSLWVMGNDDYDQLGDGINRIYPYDYITLPEDIVAYYQLFDYLLSDGTVQLSFVGWVGTNYALDCSFSLLPTNWIQQATNSAGYGGVLLFTNSPNPATNYFWRIRSVP